MEQEMIRVPKKEFEEMKKELERFRSNRRSNLPSVDEQLDMGLKDMKKGKIMRLA